MHKNSTTRCKQVVLLVIYILLSMNYLSPKYHDEFFFIRLKKKSFLLLFTYQYSVGTLFLINTNYKFINIVLTPRWKLDIE